MESTIRLFRKVLFSAFWDWVKSNKKAIGEKWYASLIKEGKNAEADCDTALKVMSTGLWIFNMIAGLGVSAGIGPNNVNLQHLDERLDERSTKRLLNLIASCLCLQYLPKEIATEPIPIISAKKFSLKLWTQ